MCCRTFLAPMPAISGLIGADEWKGRGINGGDANIRCACTEMYIHDDTNARTGALWCTLAIYSATFVFRFPLSFAQRKKKIQEISRNLGAEKRNFETKFGRLRREILA